MNVVNGISFREKYCFLTRLVTFLFKKAETGNFLKNDETLEWALLPELVHIGLSKIRCNG